MQDNLTKLLIFYQKNRVHLLFIFIYAVSHLSFYVDTMSADTRVWTGVGARILD